ncbi:MAG: hypothetical protein C4336_07015 [Armatimonadota bacterium]
MRKTRRSRRPMSRKPVSGARQVQGYLGIILASIAIVAIGVGVWLRLTPPPPPKAVLVPPKVSVYLPKVSPQGTVDYEPKEVATTSTDSTDPYRAPFEYLIHHASGFPKGTRLLRVERHGETLVLDFSRELTTNFTGGSDDEAGIINALTRTAQGFPGVRKLQILVEGRPVESIGGHIDISAPIGVGS